MFGLDMLDVAIGVAVIYLLLSLVASAVAELAESVLKYRASDLERGIRELLQESHEPSQLADQLYQHPLIAALYPGRYKSKGKHLPSYIPARTFALAFLDLVENPGAPKAKVDAAVAHLPLIPEKVKNVVDHFTTAAADDIDKKREHVEHWFNSAMDRVSGWYKRRTHTRMVLIGLGMAALLNIDSIYIVGHLNSDKAARQALVNSAAELAKTQPNEAGDPRDRIDANLAAFGKYGLPVGWDRAHDRSAYAWFLRVLGWLMTAMAVSLGAPFWFDTLNKIMVIRSTVKPTEKSRDEASEDRQMKIKVVS
jgi:hypothetical protein